LHFKRLLEFLYYICLKYLST